MNLLYKTLIYRLKDYLDKKNKSYIIISRPKNLTTFAILINFINDNNFKFKYLITNMGFVDFTPKKQDNVNDILLQIKQFYEKNIKVMGFSKYKLNNGSIVELKSIKYTKYYANTIIKVLSNMFKKCFFINTPIINKNKIFKRKRPDEFYTQLKKTNKFIKKLVSKNKKFKMINVSDIDDTFDGVHYTKKGHKLVYKRIINIIEGF